MPLQHKPVDSIKLADIQSLIENKVIEGKQIEYKEKLPSRADESGKEFLKDVSSFANASGGDLIFGIKEKMGEPVEVCGIEVADLDQEKLRLENMIRDGIEPRIPGLVVHALAESGKTLLVIRIPRSWALPHVVKYKQHWRFYSRNSAGVYQLDVPELRAAFLLSDSIGDRIRKFRTERLSMIVSGETPVPMADFPKIVLHIVPLMAASPAATLVDLSDGLKLVGDMLSIWPQGYDSRFNFDGLLTFVASARECNSYVQLFRNGSIEIVNSSMLEGTPLIPKEFEVELLIHLRESTMLLKRIDIQPPIFIMLSLLGVKGFKMETTRPTFHPTIEKKDLLVTEVMMENYELDTDRLMKPVFDAVWNACGWPKSPNYDENGNRIRGR
jgi:hypothetical protein